MTHFHGKRLPRPGVVLAAVTGLAAALGLGAVGQAGQARADEATATAPVSASAAARWTDRAHGFASLAGGTTGTTGGKVVTVADQASVDHNWFTGTKQRNPSADNCAYAHLYDNYFSAQVAGGDPVWTYGSWSRGRTRMVIENSYYDGVRHPYQADPTAELVQRGSVLRNTTGRTDTPGDAFDPWDFSSYRLDPAAAVPARVTRFSGPQRRIGGAVTLHVPGARPTVRSAVDAVPAGNDLPVAIAVAPGTYREKIHIPVTKPNIMPQGTGQHRSDTVIVYDTPGGYGGSTCSATVWTDAHDVTARNLAFSDDFDEAAHDPKGEQAPAVKTTGERIVFEGTAFPGNQDGRATAVVERPVIRALSRGSDTDNGCGTAASKWRGNPTAPWSPARGSSATRPPGPSTTWVGPGSRERNRTPWPRC